MKLNFVFNIEKHKVIVDGVGTVLKNPPVIFHKALGNGACLFNSFSILLTGWDIYNAIICHVICNYVCNLVKYANIKSYLPSRYKSRRKYISGLNMRHFNTWGTEIEIAAFAQLTGFDVYLYTEQKEWARYSHSTVSECDVSKNDFYISNESGCHFGQVTRN